MNDDHREQLVDQVTQKVSQKVSQRGSVDADEGVVRAKAEEAVDGLSDARVQSFVPLLAENAVLTDLHRGG